MKNKRLLFGIIAIALAFLLVFVGIPIINSKYNRTITVLRVTSNIEKGTVIDASQLTNVTMIAAGMPDGDYELGGQKVIVKDGTARIEGGNLAGSTSNVLDCFRNVLKWGISLPEAVHMAATNPAAAIGAENKGKIRVGADADFVVLNPQLELVATIISGEIWYRA